MPNDSYNCNISVQLSATQRIALNAESAKNPSITHNNFSFGPRVIGQNSPNPITLAIYHLYEDIDTTGIEIDLTNLPDINGGVKDATGKQLYAICITNKTANSKLMVQNAALNSYPITTDNATADVSSTVAATLVNTQDGNGSQPEIMTLTIPSTANAGSITLDSPFGHTSLTLPYNVAATTVNWAVTWLISGSVTIPSTTWSTTSPSAGVFVTTYAANASAAIPTLATQGLLNIGSSAVVTSIPAWGLHPTLITLGLQGEVVDSTHKKIKLKAVAGTIDAEITLWFIDEVV